MRNVPIHLHSRVPNAVTRELPNRRQSTRAPVRVLPTQKVQIETPADSTVRHTLVSKQPLLAMSVASVHTMCSGVTPSSAVIVTGFLIPGISAIDVPVNRVTRVHGVESLGEVVPQ